MKITTQQTLPVEVTLDDDQQRNVTATFLEKLLNWNRDYFIEDKLVKNTKTYYTSHSWKTVETVRKATPEDKFAFTVFQQIYNR